MLYGKYRFQCEFEGPAMLPAYKGSTLRGLFGSGLRKVVCALKRQECERCFAAAGTRLSGRFVASLPRKSSAHCTKHPFGLDATAVASGSTQSPERLSQLFRD